MKFSDSAQKKGATKTVGKMIAQFEDGAGRKDFLIDDTEIYTSA